MRIGVYAQLVTILMFPLRGAAEDTGARRHFTVAMRLVQLSDCRGAIDEFKQAYIAVPQPKPGILFNVARCFELLGESGEEPEAALRDKRSAVAVYRQYLHARPDARDRADAERSIEKLESDIGKIEDERRQAAARDREKEVLEKKLGEERLAAEKLRRENEELRRELLQVARWDGALRKLQQRGSVSLGLGLPAAVMATTGGALLISAFVPPMENSDLQFSYRSTRDAAIGGMLLGIGVAGVTTALVLWIVTTREARDGVGLSERDVDRAWR